jgi:hypothetical protein
VGVSRCLLPRFALPLCVLAAVAAQLIGSPAVQARPVRIPSPPAATASFTVSKYAPDVGTSGPISVVSVLPGDESKLAVAGASSGSGGIFLSSNGGASWSHDDTFPAGNVQSLIWISASEGGGWDCPCLLATAGPDFQSNNAGGLYEANDVFSSHSWTRVGNIFPAVVPAGARCGESSRGANDLAVAPDVPHRIYVATDCGVAVGTPRAGGPPSFQTVPGAPDQTVESLVALSGGRLIVGGPAIGVWTFDGVSRWSEATGPSSGGNGVGWVHAFAPDPRDAGACLPAAQHCRAYVVTELPDRVALSETTDGGASWHRINIAVARFGTSFSCGGIANVHAVEQHGRLALYAGDTCDTFSATVPLTQEPYTSLTTSDWVMLAEATRGYLGSGFSREHRPPVHPDLRWRRRHLERWEHIPSGRPTTRTGQPASRGACRPDPCRRYHS